MARRAPLQPRKEPVQARSRETARAIREAAARILATEGTAALTTNRVARVAGVSVGSLYQYFPNKQAIVAAVVEDRLAEDMAWVEALRPLLADEDVDRGCRELVDALCARQAEGAALMGALLPLLGEVQRDTLARAVFTSLSARLAADLLARPERLRPDLRDPEALGVALFAVGAAIRWGTNEALIARPDLLVDPRFRAELARVARGLFAAP